MFTIAATRGTAVRSHKGGYRMTASFAIVGLIAILVVYELVDHLRNRS
jgi:hypothetical protein